jgi:hypothetical protein
MYFFPYSVQIFNGVTMGKFSICYRIVFWSSTMFQGRIQDFKLKGGGGAHLNNLRRAEGGTNIFGVFRVKNHFFQLRREARNIFGYFMWKITILRQKIIFFPILGGHPPLDPPLCSNIYKLWEYYNRI